MSFWEPRRLRVIQVTYPQIEQGVRGFYERLAEHLAEC
jgi:hypothetical protein